MCAGNSKLNISRGRHSKTCNPASTGALTRGTFACFRGNWGLNTWCTPQKKDSLQVYRSPGLMLRQGEYEEDLQQQIPCICQSIPVCRSTGRCQIGSLLGPTMGQGLLQRGSCPTKSKAALWGCAIVQICLADQQGWSLLVLKLEILSWSAMDLIAIDAAQLTYLPRGEVPLLTALHS